MFLSIDKISSVLSFIVLPKSSLPFKIALLIESPFILKLIIPLSPPQNPRNLPPILINALKGIIPALLNPLALNSIINNRPPILEPRRPKEPIGIIGQIIPNPSLIIRPITHNKVSLAISDSIKKLAHKNGSIFIVHSAKTMWLASLGYKEIT